MPDAAPQTDDEILDRLLSDFVRAVTEGRVVEPAAVLPGRADLAVRIRETWELALEIAPRRRAGTTTAGPSIAGYEILRELGRGGMGQVHLARHEKLGRLVALKLLPGRASSARARDRFLREARAVARLDHPLIVPLYDLGETDGQLYFTMQHVEGRPASSALADLRARTRAADATGPDLARAVLGADATSVPPAWRGTWPEAAARIAVDVADALAYAHGEGVVHRDVKPSNVMLRRDGFALLFDFGLAAVADEVSLTASHGFLGTPHYASPEQAAGESESLDGRSDVFSLGATLYELLTFELPFPGPTSHEVLRRIQAWEPEPPARLNPAVPADLETVCLKALEKDRARRYASATEFADDLRAVLAGRRVRAKRAGAFERGLRLVKRSRALTELLVEQRARNAEMRGLVLRAEREERLAVQREREAEDEKRKAQAERDTARAVVAFLQEILASADPRTGSRETRVVDMLGRAESEAAGRFGSRPDVLAEILGTVAESLYGLGRYTDAMRAGRRAIDASRRAHGDDDLRTRRARGVTARSQIESGDVEGAAREFRDLADWAARTLGPRAPVTLEWRGCVARTGTHLGRFDEAEVEMRDLLVAMREVNGPGHPDTVSLETNLAYLIRRKQPEAPEAGALYEHAYDVRRRTLGELHSLTVRARGNLASWLLDVDRTGEAAAHFEVVHAALLEVFGPEHKVVLLSALNVARAWRLLGRNAETQQLAEETTATWRRVYGTSDVRLGMLLRLVARARIHVGDAAGAVSAAREAVALALASGPGTAMECALSRAVLGDLHVALGDLEAARTAFAESLDDIRVAKVPVPQVVRECVGRLVAALTAAGREADAAEFTARADG